MDHLPELLIGNDIVDLGLARVESDIYRRGYLDKLFDSIEQQLILEAPDPVLMTWKFWSMKEAAYKILNRLSGQRSFSPRSFSCSLSAGQTASGIDKVIYAGSAWPVQLQFFTKTDLLPAFLHTVALLDGLAQHINSRPYWQKIIVGDTRGEQKDQIGNLLSSTGYQLEYDFYRRPFLVDRSGMKQHPVSISHHGHFLALVSTALPE